MRSYAQSKGFVPAGITAGEYLDTAVREAGNKTALIYHDEKMSYRELAAKVNNLAASLIKLGIKHGDKVAIWMPNWPEYIIVSQAILKIGAVKVPMHINFRSVEIVTTLKHSEAKAIIMASELQGHSFAQTLDGIRQEIPNLQFVIVVGQTYADMIPLHQLLNDNPDANQVVESFLRNYPVEPDDLASISLVTTLRPLRASTPMQR